MCYSRMSHLTPLSPSDGCVGERQVLNAIPHLIHPAHSTPMTSYTSQLEQLRLAHLTPRLDHRRQVEPRALPGRPYPRPL
jgi:hypothetical protein